MTRRLFIAMAVLLGVGLAGPVAVTRAQEKKPDRVAGEVQLVNKDTKTIAVRATGTETPAQVVYDDHTKFTKDEKPGTLEDVSNGVRVICIGKLNDKGQLVATHVDVRPTTTK
jgi:hypothetical protein